MIRSVFRQKYYYGCYGKQIYKKQDLQEWICVGGAVRRLLQLKLEMMSLHYSSCYGYVVAMVIKGNKQTRNIQIKSHLGSTFDMVDGLYKIKIDFQDFCLMEGKVINCSNKYWGRVHIWLCFGNMNFKMSLVYLNLDCKNTIGSTGPQFKVEVYVGGIHFKVT